MRVGPSEPAYRSRLQTTSSCIGKESFVVSVEEKAWQKTVSGEDQGDERKRITDAVSKYQRWRQNWGSCRSPGQAQGKPVYCLSGVRHKVGINLIQAFVWNMGCAGIMVIKALGLFFPFE